MKDKMTNQHAAPLFLKGYFIKIYIYCSIQGRRELGGGPGQLFLGALFQKNFLTKTFPPLVDNI
jgi:hypothetical protein